MPGKVLRSEGGCGHYTDHITHWIWISLYKMRPAPYTQYTYSNWTFSSAVATSRIMLWIEVWWMSARRITLWIEAWRMSALWELPGNAQDRFSIIFPPPPPLPCGGLDCDPRERIVQCSSPIWWLGRWSKRKNSRVLLSRVVAGPVIHGKE